MIRPTLVALCGALLLTGCDERVREDVVTVSVIGREPRLHNPATGMPGRADAALLGAVAQGLVRLDARAQIESALARRWAISDDGLYYTFRLDRELANARDVVRQLRRLFDRYRDGSLGTRLDGIGEIIAVTPEVIEIRLTAPRPELMALLAGPAFSVLTNGKGSGPLLLDGKVGPLTTLAPPPVAEENEDERARAAAERRILLRGERVGLAVARFAKGESTLVTGGDFNDHIYTRLAGIEPRNVQIDPATGLFGFRVAGRSSALMAAEVRQALAMALDRDAIGAALGIPGWRPIQAILPPGLTDLVEPTRPFWAQAFATVPGADERALDRRLETARRIITIWRSENAFDGPLVLKIGMPDGAGSAILFATVRRQWRSIGVEAILVGPRGQADLRLIDEVAPSGQADWFLAHFLCDRGGPCSEEADQAFRTARSTTDPELRARMIAETETRLAAIAPFIPIAQPVRWSLAAPGLPGFELNARAVHPLPPLIRNQK